MIFINNEGRRVEADVESNEMMRNIVRERGWQPVHPETLTPLPKPAMLAPIQPGLDPIGLIMAAETGEIHTLPPEYQNLNAMTAPPEGHQHPDSMVPDRELMPMGAAPLEAMASQIQNLQAQLSGLSQQLADGKSAPPAKDKPPGPASDKGSGEQAVSQPAAEETAREPVPVEPPAGPAEDVPEVPIPDDLPEDMHSEFRARFPSKTKRPEEWEAGMCQGLNKDGRQCRRALGKGAMFCKQHQELFDNYTLIAGESAKT